MFDVVGKHSIAAKANTTIKGLTEGQLGAEVVKGIIEQIQCVGHLQLHGLVIYTDLTRFNKIATQGAPQMAVDKEANSLSRVYSYYSKFNLCLFYV